MNILNITVNVYGKLISLIWLNDWSFLFCRIEYAFSLSRGYIFPYKNVPMMFLWNSIEKKNYTTRNLLRNTSVFE